MEFLPIFLRVKDRPCLVVGGGNIATRKTELLQKAGAKVTVISPQLSSVLTDMHDAGSIKAEIREFEPGDLNNVVCVIAATDNRALNESISQQAYEQNLPVNVVDNPELCSFIMPSIIDRDPVQIAVSTGGSSPVLARKLRSKLEATIPGAFGELARLSSLYRDKVKESFNDVESRKRFWEEVFDGPIAEQVYSGRFEEAEDRLKILISQRSEDFPAQGEVYLVGAGPGDPDLITFKALRLIQKADVVVYDRLVSEPILNLVRRDAEKIYAGKASANHAIPQENINQLLVRLAKEGKRVLRLKGGDPFIFGRGGEEIAELVDENISFQVVPGITAASGCTTYAGIPLTHRDHSQACIFVTGHRRAGHEELNWEMLSHANQTVVFYMGLENVQRICDSLKNHGRDASTPAALIEKGTTPDQRVFIGDLNSLPGLIEENNVKAPTLIVVGEVVSLYGTLGWYQKGQQFS